MRSSDIRVGMGFDSHRLKKGGDLRVGGVLASQDLGVCAHSDGDALCHALIDALLGASGCGDIGTLFPDTDQRFKGASSVEMLSKVWEKVRAKGFYLINADLVVILEKPKIAQLRERIVESLASAMGVEKERIWVKGKRPEGAFQNKTYAAYAVVLLGRDA